MIKHIDRYITPIFFYVKKINGEILFSSVMHDNDFFEYVLSLESINDFFYELSQWVPNSRYIFIGSRHNFLSTIKSEEIEKWENCLISKNSKKMFSQFFNFLNIDPYHSNAIKEPISSLLHLVNSYDCIVTEELWEELADRYFSDSKEVNSICNELSWERMMLMGLPPADIFEKCGNHMLSRDFINDGMQKELNKVQFLMSMKVNKASFISELENSSMQTVSKIYYDIIVNEENSYSFLCRSNNCDITLNINGSNIDSAMNELINLIPAKRTFVTFGEKNIQIIKELCAKYKNEVLEEILETTIDLRLPFNSLLNPSLETMLNMFSIKNKFKNDTSKIQALDEKIIKDMDNTSKVFYEETLKKLSTTLPLSPSKLNEIESQYGKTLMNIIGQSLKFFYSSSNVN